MKLDYTVSNLTLDFLELNVVELSWFSGWGRPLRPRRVKRFEIVAGKVGSSFKPVEFSVLRDAFLYWHAPTSSAQRSFLNGGVSKLREAVELMRELHSGQIRKTGEPYEVHPFSVAYWAAESGSPLPVVIAGLLHDTVEDCGIPLSEIRKRFGDEVAYLVGRVSTPKYRANAGGVVFPHQDGYSFPETDRDRAWKEEHGSKLIELQGSLLLKDPVGLTRAKRKFGFVKQNLDGVNVGRSDFLGQLDFYALLLKSMDFAHNASKSQISSMKQAEKHFLKSMKMGIPPLLDNLSPAFRNSAPHFGSFFESISKNPRKYGAWTLLPSRGRLRGENLSELIPTNAPTIHLHGTESGKEYDVKFPHFLFGSSEKDQLRLQKILAERLAKNNPGAGVEKAESLLPPGLASYHIFRVNRGEMPFSQFGKELNRVYRECVRR